MNRRNCLAALCALGASSLSAHAQQARKISRLCFITFDPGSLQSNRHGAFFESLRSLGYSDDKNIKIDYLSANGRAEKFPELAAECLRLKSDVIVAATTPAAQAAKAATRTIPVVMLALGDPVGAGLIDNFARPGGNVTGMSFQAPTLAAKRLELLKEMVPRLSRVLVLTYGIDPISAPQVERMKTAAGVLGLTLFVRDLRVPEDIPAAFDAGVKERVDGLITTAESFFAINQARVIELAARHRLPAAYSNSRYASAGGLMSYMANFPALYAGAAAHVDRILKGAKPADLPVEQPTKFELLINLQTAKALGISVPPTLMVRADKLID